MVGLNRADQRIFSWDRAVQCERVYEYVVDFQTGRFEKVCSELLYKIESDFSELSGLDLFGFLALKVHLVQG